MPTPKLVNVIHSTYYYDNSITLHTSYDFPPIPIRSMDWSCVDDNYDGAPDAGYQIVGTGKTEQEAIDNWFELYDDWYEYNGKYEISEK